MYSVTVYPLLSISFVLFLKTIMLLRYYNYNYQKIRDQEIDETYPRIGY
jgi:hypothetical protein